MVSETCLIENVTGVEAGDVIDIPMNATDSIDHQHSLPKIDIHKCQAYF